MGKSTSNMPEITDDFFEVTREELLGADPDDPVIGETMVKLRDLMVPDLYIKLTDWNLMDVESKQNVSRELIAAAVKAMDKFYPNIEEGLKRLPKDFDPYEPVINFHVVAIEEGIQDVQGITNLDNRFNALRLTTAMVNVATISIAASALGGGEGD